jgi:hypothetical protein
MFIRLASLHLLDRIFGHHPGLLLQLVHLRNGSESLLPEHPSLFAELGLALPEFPASSGVAMLIIGGCEIFLHAVELMASGHNPGSGGRDIGIVLLHCGGFWVVLQLVFERSPHGEDEVHRQVEDVSVCDVCEEEVHVSPGIDLPFDEAILRRWSIVVSLATGHAEVGHLAVEVAVFLVILDGMLLEGGYNIDEGAVLAP